MKLHAIPSVASMPSSVDPSLQVLNEEIPPPTAIATIQAIGTHLCAILEEELTVAALTEDPKGASSSA